MKGLFVTFILLFYGPVLWAVENLELNLQSGTTMSITHYQGDAKSLLMWIPFERGFQPGYVPVALNLAVMGYDIWAVDLHGSYMVPASRNSMNKFDPHDLVELFKIAQAQGYKEIFLLSSGRGVQLALKALYLFQLDQTDSRLIKGSVFFYPHLIEGRPNPGMQAEFVEISKLSNLPVYLFMPEYSTKYAHRLEISKQLQKGGSAVFIHNLKDVNAGFHMRPEEDLTEPDMAMKDKLPDLYENAFRLIRGQPYQPLFQKVSLIEKEDPLQSAYRESKLHPYRGEKTPPELNLSEIGGQVINLQDFKGQVVLVNFWATWCGPCVEEIPSLSRMEERLKDKPFKILTVNIGEPKKVILKFMEEIDFRFPIMMDVDGQAARDWKVYAYPSNYLIDKKGKIQYAYRGALEWDAPEILKTIESLF